MLHTNSAAGVMRGVDRGRNNKNWDGLHGRYKQHVRQACDPCRERKVKCDGGEPCGKCLKRKAPHLCMKTRVDKRLKRNADTQARAQGIATAPGGLVMDGSTAIQSYPINDLGHPLQQAFSYLSNYDWLNDFDQRQSLQGVITGSAQVSAGTQPTFHLPAQFEPLGSLSAGGQRVEAGAQSQYNESALSPLQNDRNSSDTNWEVEDMFHQLEFEADTGNDGQVGGPTETHNARLED